MWLSPRTAITGYGGDRLSSCLGLYRCATRVEVKFTPGTLRQKKAHSSTHSGCSWLGRSREETAFYHFIYWQRCKITGDVLNRWKRGDAAKEGLRGRKQILLFVRQESCIRSIYLLCQLVVFLNLLLPPVPAAQSSPLNDVIRS